MMISSYVHTYSICEVSQKMVLIQKKFDKFLTFLNHYQDLPYKPTQYTHCKHLFGDVVAHW